MSTTATPTRAAELAERLLPLYSKLASHRLYASFHTIADLRLFMESHIFAVWDFMSLLKALQRELTCVDTPWVPSRTPASRRLVNEIVLGEESDHCRGEALSHFEIYLRAMHACGASTASIDHLITLLRDGSEFGHALIACNAPAHAATFVRSTFDFLNEGKLHSIAAAFTFGREDLIPEIFKGFVRDLNTHPDRTLAGQLDLFLWYLERHIEVDGEEHGPMALSMIADLCGNDETKWREAEQAAIIALEARLQLWDGITNEINNRKPKLTTNLQDRSS